MRCGAKPRRSRVAYLGTNSAVRSSSSTRTLIIDESLRRLLFEDFVPDGVEHAECQGEPGAENPAEVPHQYGPSCPCRFSSVMRPLRTLNTQVVYARIMGRKTATAPSIRSSVFPLLEASHTVRLWLGKVEEGIKNGNRAKPPVRIVPACTSALAKTAAPAWRDRRHRFAQTADSAATAGAAHIQGHVWKLFSHAPAALITVFRVGSEGPD